MGECAVATSVGTRDFDLTDGDFAFVQRLAREHTGIVISEAKRDMVYGRLVKRIRDLGLRDFGAYCALLRDDPGDELVRFVNALTTNLTSFFREKHHFEFLAQHLVPQWRLEKGRSRSLRIWSAGCSTGEEPYSIAMALREALPESEKWSVRILATDLDSDVLQRAEDGIYAMERIKGVPQATRNRWFLKGTGRSEGMVRVRPELCDMITFRQLNLLGEWPFREDFDAIFCRNVVIYFDKTTQRTLFERFAGVTREEGHLFLGHSESMYRICDRFQLVGTTTYRRVR